MRSQETSWSEPREPLNFPMHPATREVPGRRVPTSSSKTKKHEEAQHVPNNPLRFRTASSVSAARKEKSDRIMAAAPLRPLGGSAVVRQTPAMWVGNVFELLRLCAPRSCPPLLWYSPSIDPSGEPFSKLSPLRAQSSAAPSCVSCNSSASS